MIYDLILLLARVLMATLFVNSALAKVRGDKGERKAMAGVHIPYPGLMERLAGWCELLGAAMLVFGIGTRIAAWLLICFLVVATALFIRFWSMPSEGGQRENGRNAFFSNLSSIAGLGYIAVFGPGAWALLPDY